MTKAAVANDERMLSAREVGILGGMGVQHDIPRISGEGQLWNRRVVLSSVSGDSAYGETECADMWC